VEGADLDQLRSAARKAGRLHAGQTRPMPLAPLTQLAALRTLDANTPLTLRSGLLPALRGSGDGLAPDVIALDVIDSTLNWAIGEQDALTLVLSGVTFRPADLPNLDPDQQLAMAHRLLTHGVVVPTGSTDSPSG
jgi:hypothetical protein